MLSSSPQCDARPLASLIWLSQDMFAEQPAFTQRFKHRVGAFRVEQFIIGDRLINIAQILQFQPNEAMAHLRLSMDVIDHRLPAFQCRAHIIGIAAGVLGMQRMMAVCSPCVFR